MSKQKKKEYKVPSRRQPIFKVVGGIIKLFGYRKIKVLNLGDEIEQKSIFVSNHAGKQGPMAIEYNMPFNVKWGDYRMLGNYRTRRKYLRDVHYRIELHKGKFVSSVRASVEALFSKMLYKGMKFIATYHDFRFIESINNSIKVLDSNMAITILPENAEHDGGYLDVIKSFQPGFVALAEMYYKKRGEDLPVYPMYYSHKAKLLVVDKPMYVNEMRNSGMSRADVAQAFCDKVNSLYFEYIK